MTDHLTPFIDEEGVKHVYETVKVANEAYRKLGIRAFIAPLISDLDFTMTYPTPEGKERKYEGVNTEQILKEMERAIQDFHKPEEGIHIMVGPTGIQLASDDLLKGCVALSKKYGVARHIHCLETKAQERLGYEKYGCSVVEHLRDLDFLGPTTSCAHCVWLNDKDIEIFRETGTTAVHNALSNIRLGSGIAPILTFKERGVNVSFGCDGAASNDSQNMLEAIKIGSLLHNTTTLEYKRWIKPLEAVRMAAQGGAIGYGLGDTLGSITVGKRADFVLYSLTNHLSMLPRTDPLGMLLWGRAQQVVQRVWVDGHMVVDDFKCVGVDEAWLRQEILTLAPTHQWKPRASPLREELEPEYRSVMGLEGH